MSTIEFNAFKKKVVKLKVQDNQLFCRNSKNVPIRQVVNDPTERQTILQQLHEKSSHKGREGTYQRMADQYWWDN